MPPHSHQGIPLSLLSAFHPVVSFLLQESLCLLCLSASVGLPSHWKHVLVWQRIYLMFCDVLRLQSWQKQVQGVARTISNFWASWGSRILRIEKDILFRKILSCEPVALEMCALKSADHLFQSSLLFYRWFFMLVFLWKVCLENSVFKTGVMLHTFSLSTWDYRGRRISTLSANLVCVVSSMPTRAT